jgi:signal transduction histidine kinase
MQRSSVLVVEDDPTMLLALGELLTTPGRVIVTARSGAEALRHVLEQDFAVILLDVRMPDMDGIATAKLIRKRERSRDTPIIFLTGANEDPVSRARGYEVGAVDYLIKPLVPEVLKSKVAVFIELDRYNAALAKESGDRKLIEENLRKSEERLRQYAGHIQSIREEERASIAREVHDELGQALTALKMDLLWIEKRLPADSDAPTEKIKSMFEMIDSTIQSVRKISSGLRPQVLDDAGLIGALKWQAREFQMRTGVRCNLDLAIDDIVLEQDRATAVFRIFQEVLTNVARHAKATRVDVELGVAGEHLVLKIADNGRGISDAELKSPKSLGILGIRERALLAGGSVEITGGEAGTAVTLRIPLRAPGAIHEN